MVDMKPARRPFGRRAGSVLAAATLVAALFTWLPLDSAGVIAIAADQADPSGSPAPEPTPTPTPDATPTPDPTPPPDPSPPPDPTPPPDPSPGPEPSPSIDPTPEPSPTPSPTPTPTPTPYPPGVVGPDGGVVEASNVTLNVPAGAVIDPTRFSITPVWVPDPETGVALFGFAIDANDDATGSSVQWFGTQISFVIDAGAWDFTGIDTTSLDIVELSNGHWTTIGTGSADSLAASTAYAGTYAVLGRLLPARVDIEQTSDAPDRGRHRLEPGSLLEVTISVRLATRLTSGTLIETIPAGWWVVDDDGGSFDLETSTVSWPLRSLAGGTTVKRTLRVRAPSVPFGGQLAVRSTLSVRVEQGASRTDGPDLAILVAPRVLVPHVTAGQVGGAATEATYLAPDRPLVDEPRFEVFRLRFDVRNADSVPVRWTPRLELRPSSGGAFVPLPAGENVTGIAFYAAPEWERKAGGGTAIGRATAELDGRDPAADGDAAEEVPVAGSRAMGLNPLPDVVLPPLSRTIVEFSVRATVDAEYLAGYEFRLTDVGETFVGAAEALVVLEAAPALQLSPRQRIGVPAGDRPDATLTPIRFALSGPAPTTPTAGSTGSASDAPTEDGATSLRFALVDPTGAITASAVSDPVHGPSYSLATDACAACHRSHVATGPQLTRSPAPQLGLCGSCHDGVTAPDVQAGYSAAPVNDPADRAYYRHEPTADAGHASDADDALAGQLNRHNECADCHNPHNATSASSVVGASGWTASGRIAGASGVTATYGALSGPTYTLVAPTELEYQLCLKCHSGYTQLPSNEGLPPSRFALDTGVEFDPANLSYHPVEAAGTNGTPAMAASLSGMSPFKQWSFTPASTVRCVNCHADSRVLAEATPDAVPADASLPVHASANRGILIAAYRDRQLKGLTEAYAASDFALCYLCHAEAPFRDTTGGERLDTNFPYHGLHVSGDNLLDHGSAGTDIDTAGDGGGLATCAECHFRIHSTSFAVNGQAAGSRLVNFAPNVTAPTGGTITWRQKTGSLPGTCAVKCHSQPHADDY